jgi:Transglycosylase-like domain
VSTCPRTGTEKMRRLFLIVAAACAVSATAVFSDPASAGSGGVVSVASSDSEPASGSVARYERIWWGLEAGERRWANRTSACESGRNPRAIGGGGLYRGAFQFMRSTWRASPKSPGGDPIAYPYRTQAVVAVMLKRRDGAGHWPVCG